MKCLTTPNCLCLRVEKGEHIERDTNDKKVLCAVANFFEEGKGAEDFKTSTPTAADHNHAQSRKEETFFASVVADQPIQETPRKTTIRAAMHNTATQMKARLRR